VTDLFEPRAFYGADSLGTEVYDALAASTIAGSPVEGDIDFYRRLAGETGGPILDVGCGTGRVAVALAADGHEVVGIDLSAPMLRQAGQRRAALPDEVAGRLSFQQADMATLALGRDFALIVAPSRVFQFLLTTEAQRQALAALRAHLRPSGRLVLDLFDPLLDLVVPSTDHRARGGELVHPTTGTRVTWEVAARMPDPAHQRIVEDWTFREFDASGEVLRTETERLTLRWSLRSEMRLLFELAGLEVVADYGDFRGGPPAYGREQVWVTRARVPLPVLSDGRVLLRAVEPRDLPAIEAGIHDPDVIRWIGSPEGSAHDVLVQSAERWAHGSPTLAICELDGTCVGKVWMHIPETDRSTGFVGYWLLPVGRGRGLATSAVRLLSAWAVRELGLASVRLVTAPDNPRSQQVAERSGFRRVPERDDEAVDGVGQGIVYELDERLAE
jgi:RimJ/RimL family protein N-acetyltransferase/protein-L-isoaspartate O-methyltransferase